MTTLLHAEMLRRLTELEARVDLLSRTLAKLTAPPPVAAAEWTAEPAPAAPWQVTSTGGA